MPPAGSPAPAPKGAPKPAPAPAPKPGLDLNELVKLDASLLRAIADQVDIKAGKTPPVVVADPAVAATAAEEAKKKLDAELEGKRKAAKEAAEAEEKEGRSKRRKWLLLKILFVILAPLVAWTLGSNAARRGLQASVTVGQTTVPIMPSYPNLSSDLDAANKRIAEILKEKEELEMTRSTTIADVQSQLRAKRHELDVALIRATTAELNSNSIMVEAAQRQRDQAILAMNAAKADVVEITSQMTGMALIHSQTVAQLRSEHAAATSALESSLNQTKARELSAKDEVIAQLQRVVQSQRLDIQNLQFAAQGSTVAANGLTNVEILAPAIPARNRFSVRFEQRRVLNFDITVTNRNLETQCVVQVPPGLYTVTRLVDGQPFGNPVETMIWPGIHRSWFQFGNNGTWHTVERSNPFIAFWNGVGEQRLTLPNGQVRLVNGDMVTVENGRVRSANNNK